MVYQLKEINARARANPRAFLAAADADFQGEIQHAADRIIENRKQSPVVLLAGPSGAGKTTSSLKIREELLRRGIKTHTISMDNYFLSVSPLTTPRTQSGDYDFESPLCLDMELLNEHFSALNRGEAIRIPRYDFTRHMRDTSRCTFLQLKPDEIAIFEGIHALNTEISGKHPEAFKIYLTVQSSIAEGNRTVFKNTWIRLSRRSIRDMNFRDTEVLITFDMWENIRRGEKLYISPFKGEANLIFDAFLPYEVNVMVHYANRLFHAIPEKNIRRKEMLEMIRAFDRFEPIDPALVASDSLLREFIGGGTYDAH